MDNETLSLPTDYGQWLADIKGRVLAAQQKAALAANAELISLYWHIGRDILERQTAQGWGSKVIDRLGRDLREAFPEMKGFSRANLLYMRAFAEAWRDFTIVQQLVGQLPWGHNVLLLTRVKDQNTRLFYAQQAIAQSWSRTTLELHIKNRLYERQGQAVTNFATRLPSPVSALAQRNLERPLSV